MWISKKNWRERRIKIVADSISIKALHVTTIKWQLLLQRMGQRFKNIYFADFPGDSARERNLTLAFGDKDAELYQAIKPLSSHEIRERLGHAGHQSLIESARRENLPLNTYCLRLLRDSQAALSPGSNGELIPDPNAATRPLIDPIQATFRGGHAEPLHDWYPFLEGYSPRFVEQVLQEFAPNCERVLDPFAGTGTTPLTAVRLGREAFFCELNPLLQLLRSRQRDRRNIARCCHDCVKKQRAAWKQLAAVNFSLARFFVRMQQRGGREKCVTWMRLLHRRHSSTAPDFIWRTGCAFGFAVGKQMISASSRWRSWTVSVLLTPARRRWRRG
ncbi:MAG: hypothetical protein KGJ60_15435 [Verrucomicrobiota bacterium]|nr:hypothetical protein [Verrucomicrobiota bacterium]